MGVTMAAFAVDHFLLDFAQESTIKARQFSCWFVFFSFIKRWNKKRTSLAWFLHIMMLADVDQEKNNTCALVACHVHLPPPVAFSPTIKSGTFFRSAPPFSTCQRQPLRHDAIDLFLYLALISCCKNLYKPHFHNKQLTTHSTHFSSLLFLPFLFFFSHTDAKVLRRKSPWRRHPRVHDQPS